MILCWSSALRIMGCAVGGQFLSLRADRSHLQSAEIQFPIMSTTEKLLAAFWRPDVLGLLPRYVEPFLLKSRNDPSTGIVGSVFGFQLRIPPYGIESLKVYLFESVRAQPSQHWRRA